MKNSSSLLGKYTPLKRIRRTERFDAHSNHEPAPIIQWKGILQLDYGNILTALGSASRAVH